MSDNESDKDQSAVNSEKQPGTAEAPAAEQASARPESGEAESREAAGAADRASEASSAGSQAENTTEPSAEEEIARLQEEVAKARDTALRAQAEAQNAKRRAEQDVEKAHKYALERFAGELLPVVDNLERALDSAGGDDEVIKPIAEGVELTLKSFLDVLQKYNIEAVDPQGEPFDPQLHQAMSQVESPDVEPNTVIAVMQKGYTLNGRLVRPAMVMVSKDSGAAGKLDEHA